MLEGYVGVFLEYFRDLPSENSMHILRHSNQVSSEEKGSKKTSKSSHQQMFPVLVKGGVSSI